jgi:hypothetical protein
MTLDVHPGSGIFPSRIQGSKKHWIPYPDSQFGLLLGLCIGYNCMSDLKLFIVNGYRYRTV